MFWLAPLLLSALAYAEPVEETFGDWKYTKLSFGHSSSTKGLSGPNARRNFGAGCEEGVFSLRVMDVALLMTGQTDYKTEISYDGEAWVGITNDLIPVEQLPKIFAGTQLHVRWHIKEGLVSESFSLKGAAEAIRPVAAACNVQLPKE